MYRPIVTKWYLTVIYIFQNIMNDIFNSFSHFTIVYIDDVLVYSSSIDEHWKHLHSFFDTIKRNGIRLVRVCVTKCNGCEKNMIVIIYIFKLKCDKKFILILFSPFLKF